MESRLDQIYRSVILTKFFTRGWGHPDTLTKILRLRKVLSVRENVPRYLTGSPRFTLTKEERQDGCTLIDGHFESPLAEILPEVLPPECRRAHFQAVLPEHWPANGDRPVVLQLAGTGDHFFWRRRTLMAKPLVKERGVGSLLLENPYYGLRKPKDQLRSSLHYVSDLFVMGACLILESQVLLRWAEQQGLGPLCCHGISMGGHMASLAACTWPRPISLVPCLAWTSASVTFCQGVMAQAINWKQLKEQYESMDQYRTQVWELVRSPEFELSGLRGEGLFLEDSFLTANSRLNLASFSAAFRDSSTDSDPAQQRTSIEAFIFMRGLMDECTHLGNYSMPVDTELIEIVAAEYDAYQPRKSVKPLDQLWPGSKIRYVKKGHVSSYLFNQSVFRQAIYDALDLYRAKYPS